LLCARPTTQLVGRLVGTVGTWGETVCDEFVQLSLLNKN